MSQFSPEPCSSQQSLLHVFRNTDLCMCCHILEQRDCFPCFFPQKLEILHWILVTVEMVTKITHKELVINYGEGATKCENRGSETFRVPHFKTG